MKRIMFLLIMTLPLVAYGQRGGYITAADDLDTTIWIEARNCTLVEIDFSGLDASTDSLWVGYSNDKKGFVCETGWPKVLDKAETDYRVYVNGTWRYRVGQSSVGKWPGEYVAIRYKVVGSTADLILNYTLGGR